MNNNLILSNDIIKQNGNNGDIEQDLQTKYLSENSHKGSILKVEINLAVDLNFTNSPRELKNILSRYSYHYLFIIVSTNKDIALRVIQDIDNDFEISEIELLSIFNAKRKESLSRKPIYSSLRLYEVQ